MPILDTATEQLVDRLDFVSRMLQRADAAGQRGRPLATVYRDVRRALCAVLQLHLGETFDSKAKPGVAQLHDLMDRLPSRGTEIVDLMAVLRDLPDQPVELDWRLDGDHARQYLHIIRERITATSHLAALLNRDHLAAQGLADGLWLTAPRHQNCVDEYFIVDLFSASGPSLWHMQGRQLVSYALHSLFDPRYFSALTDPVRLRICEDSLVCKVRFAERAGIAADTPSDDPAFDSATTLLRCSIAGIQHGALVRAERLPEPGTWLQLQRQPDNLHDPRAVRVLTSDGLDIGYLPRKVNAGIANRLDQGWQLRAHLLGWHRDFDQGIRPNVTMDLEVRSLEVQDGPGERERKSLEDWILTDARRRVPQPRFGLTNEEARNGQWRLRADHDRDQARRGITNARMALTRGDIAKAMDESLQAAQSLACVWMARHAYDRLSGPFDRVERLVLHPGAPAWACTLATACHETRMLLRPGDGDDDDRRAQPVQVNSPLARPGADPALVRRALELVGRIEAIVQSVVGDPRDPMSAFAGPIVIGTMPRVPARLFPERPYVIDLPIAQRTGLMRTLRRLKELTELVEAGQHIQPTRLRCLRSLGRFPLLEWEVLQRIANQEYARLPAWEIDTVDPRLAELGVTATRKGRWIARAFYLIERPWQDRQEASWLAAMLHELQPVGPDRRVMIDSMLSRIEALLQAAAPKLDHRLMRLALDYCVDHSTNRTGILDGPRLRLLTESLCIEATGFYIGQLSGLYPPLTAAPLPWQVALAAWHRSLASATQIAPRLRQDFLATARMQLEISLLGCPGRLPRRAWKQRDSVDA